MVIYLDQYKRIAAPMLGRAMSGACTPRVKPRKWPTSVFYLYDDVAQRTISPDLPYDLTKVDMDIFMGRVYALATQI